ncbi:hypothetical protein [Cyclobacterium roseum]|uniref:hypothetical protein n=1 Tax=Cyclobacterium roseum TaxID=2666137 RepID=UPI00139095D9|nr:hypothetical protein [Cyclobacterium roseum]
MKNVIQLCLLLLCIFTFCPVLVKGQQITEPVKAERVWDKAPHNAFPDLIRFKNYFYASVREGNNHMPDNSGQVRIIRSKDGETWEPVGLLERDDMDVREARLSVTPEGKIMVLTAVGIYENGYQELYPMVSFSDKKGINFSSLEKTTMDITPTLDWIWSLTWHEGTGYGVIYQIKGEEWETHLLKTQDGKHYSLVAPLEITDRPNEATTRFDKDGKMHVLVRREAGDTMGMLASSKFPYKEWEYHKLPIRLGGPNFLFLDDENIVIGSRDYRDNSARKTGLFLANTKGAVKRSIYLPSGGDTSYPGMVFHKNELWVLYYSSHEEKTNIYLAKIPVNHLK